MNKTIKPTEAVAKEERRRAEKDGTQRLLHVEVSVNGTRYKMKWVMANPSGNSDRSYIYDTAIDQYFREEGGHQQPSHKAHVEAFLRNQADGRLTPEDYASLRECMGLVVSGKMSPHTSPPEERISAAG